MLPPHATATTTPAAATPPGATDQREAARQAAIAEAKRKSQAKYASAGGADNPNSPEYVGDLARLQRQHDAERAAAQHDLAASKAQALQTAAAKSGAAGFGLSGASAALQGDVGSAADRNSVLTMADLRGKQNDENFTELQREVALTQAEEDSDTDINHDGMINGHKVGGVWGDHNPDNNPAKDAAGQHAQSRAKVEAIRGSMSGDGGGLSPYEGSEQDAQDLLAAGVTFNGADARYESDGHNASLVVRGVDGKLYKFHIDQATYAAASADPHWASADGYAAGKILAHAMGIA